jgi:hypothetical protein
MPRIPAPALIFLAVAPLLPALASLEPPGGAETILRAEEHRDRAEAVPAWDPSSPQRLVRLDGELYQEEAGEYYPVVEDRISVRLAEGVASWDELVLRTGDLAPGSFALLSRLEPLRANRLGIVDLATPPGADLAAWAELIHRTGLVRYAELNTHGRYLATPTDPRYPEQWALNNTGQTGGSPGADMDAELAWDLETGDPSVIVAVIDSGTDVDHEDLAVNVWHNEDEIPDNGLDDDGNGYIDDWEGWDFNWNDNDPRTGSSHGTHVTGVVNAAGSNGVGIVGLAGGLGAPGVKGMALGIGDTTPNSGVIDDAILYAADNGARVITISSAVGPSQAISDALAYAYGTKDVFIDCASGNSSSAVAFPATRPEVAAVGATNHNDSRSWFSNYGPELELVAPGEDILSTRPNDGYASDDGTSFAAPYVAGLAALVRSRNPGLQAPEVRELIRDTAEDLGSPGWDQLTGHGRIDAFEAVSGAADPDGRLYLDRGVYSCADLITLTVWDADLSGAGTLAVEIWSDTESGGETVTLSEAGAGSGVFRGTVTTSSGPPSVDGVLQLADADSVVAEYLDADDGQGGTNVLKTAPAQADCRAPVISGVASQDISTDRATVVWSTDEPATSLVRYGLAPPPGQQASDSGLVSSHALTLTGLDECSTYRFEVESADPSSNGSVDDNGGLYHSFVTWGDYPDIGIAPCTRGRVSLDRAGTYGCEDSVGVQVIDVDLDTDPQAVETVEVLLSSTTEPAGEWLTLTEISVQSSRFEGSLPTSGGAPLAGDGLLSVHDGDLITATYHDEDDGQGQARTATATSTADCTPPFLSGIRVTEISSTRAVIEWSSDEPATSKVEFGPTAALGSVVEDTALVSSHRLAISPFQACDRVHLRVSGTDEHGALRVADAGGQPFTFNLNQIGGLVFFEDFESETGWTLEGEWERGTPLGLGSNAGDPSGAWSGSGALGNDLSGLGVFPGDYEPSTTESAFSPVFSTRQERDLELIVRRRLGVLSADEASIHVITNGSDQVWTSSFQFNDDQWYELRRSISAWADNKSSVQIEFRLESLSAERSFGWNVDEVIVKDSTQPDYLSCGGCAGAPTFGGVSSVFDPDPCGTGGLVVSWDEAPAWGTGTGGTYEVHRGTSPDFLPDAGNRVASGLTGNTWTDAGAPVDTPVWYLVRARNDESCGGGGLDDGNLVRLGATETVSRPLPDPVGATLLVGTVGGAHVRLEWSAAGGAEAYRVRRSESPDFSGAVELGTVETLLYEDQGAAPEPGLYTYLVSALDACGREE